MRILSSAEKCRRVARRMSLSTRSAGTSELMGFGLIGADGVNSLTYRDKD